MNLFFQHLQALAQPPPFNVTYRAFPVACTSKTPAAQAAIEQGDKIVLPPSALDHLAKLKVTYPMMFEVTNARTTQKSHCGVLEFSADEGIAYLPYWMMENLGLESGSMLQVRNVTLPKGKFVQLQPHKTKFVDLANPRAVLEQALRSFSCLTKGDTIAIRHGDATYQLDIVEVQPGNAISIYETDVNVDFKEPKDYKEYTKQQEAKKAASAAASAAAPPDVKSQSNAQKAANAVVGKTATGADDAGGGWGAASGDVISHSSSATSPNSTTSSSSHVSYSASSSSAASPSGAAAAARAARAAANGSPAGAASSPASSASGSGKASGANYFAQLKGEGYRLKPSKPGAATAATTASPSANGSASGAASANGASTPQSTASASGSAAAATPTDSSDRVVRRVGGFEYTYQIVNGKEKLLRRRAINASTPSSSTSATSAASPAGAGGSFKAFSGAGNKLK